MAEQPVYKIMLLGNAGVGKSSLVHRFADNTFNGTYTATIGIDFKTRAVELDGQRIKLQIWARFPPRVYVCQLTPHGTGHCRTGTIPQYYCSVLQRSGRRCTCI
eukprot:TRINITY_DN1624_c0_g1_i6.p1 TRINITY_DN1624_c0_g1~~TRINITY_DN1624_c0_g1_i6.p1  ORF type:complete len:104 (-),score=2.06 TRINITY_DN1624_c0_g1_i6:520-831(-)